MTTNVSIIPTTTREKNPRIVKIAVEILNEPDKIPQFIECDQSEPLSSIIQLLCKHWALPDPENFTLRFSEVDNQELITEENRNKIHNGSVLRLQYLPAICVKDILNKINNGSPTEQSAALTKLSYLSTDVVFVEEFFRKNGINLIINNIENGSFKDNSLKYALISFIKLMDHGFILWDVLEDEFINKIASFVNNQATTQDPKVIQCCLSILENIVLNSSKNSHVKNEITIPNLIQHLQNHKQDSTNVIALINAIFSKSDMTRRKSMAASLSSKQGRSIIYESLIGGSDCSKENGIESMDKKLAHQLYILQTLLLSLLEPKMRQRADAQEQESQDKMKELRRIANESELSIKGVMRRETNVSKSDNKQLAFNDEKDQLSDFNQVPPGVLALDCLLYFAKTYSRDYRNIVIKSSSKGDECSFGKISVELVKLMCEILQVGQPPSEQGRNFHPLIFSHEKPFEELFCICIIVLNKIRVEMKATADDVGKVMCVFNEHINRALSTSPRNLNEFRERISQRSFADFTRIWQRIRTTCRKKIGHFK